MRCEGCSPVDDPGSACLARDGHEVLGIDLDPTKLKLLSDGKAPIIEDGIDESHVTRPQVVVCR